MELAKSIALAAQIQNPVIEETSTAIRMLSVKLTKLGCIFVTNRNHGIPAHCHFFNLLFLPNHHRHHAVDTQETCLKAACLFMKKRT